MNELDKAALDFVKHCAAVDNIIIRPILTQVVIMDSGKGYIGNPLGGRVAVAADGFRLAVAPVSDEIELGILPAGKTKLSEKDNTNFPSYMDIIPSNLVIKSRVAIKVADLKQAVRSSIPIAHKVNNTLYLVVSDTEDKMYVRVESNELGQVETMIDCDRRGDVLSQQIAMALNAVYLRDMLSYLSDDSEIVLWWSANDKAVLWQMGNWIEVIMPMNVERAYTDRFLGARMTKHQSFITFERD